MKALAQMVSITAERIHLKVRQMAVWTNSWLGRNIKYWERHLPQVFPGDEDRVYLEIGVFDGRSADWLLERFFRSDGSKAYLIDTFQSPSRRRSILKLRQGREKIWNDSGTRLKY